MNKNTDTGLIKWLFIFLVFIFSLWGFFIAVQNPHRIPDLKEFFNEIKALNQVFNKGQKGYLQQILRLRCSNNLRLVEKAIYAYALDHNGSMPYDWQDLTEGKNPYIDKDITICPLTGRQYILNHPGANLYNLDSYERLATCGGEDSHNISVLVTGVIK